MLIGLCDLSNASLVLVCPSLNLFQIGLSTFYILFLFYFMISFMIPPYNKKTQKLLGVPVNKPYLEVLC